MIANVDSASAPVDHDLPFDPTHGYDLAALLAAEAPDAPGDFDDFWQARHRAARQVDPAPQLSPPVGEADGHRVHLITYTSVGGVRVGGWLTVPAEGRVTRGCVFLHGYGGRERPETELALPGAATIWPCARGLGARSLIPHIPATSDEHVLHGITSRDTYVHGGCVDDVWCAVSALRTLVPQVADCRLDYLGESFGGGIGALAVPWDERIDAAALVVPSFGNHALRLSMPCTGSGEAVRRHYAQHPEIAATLRYFDAATAATRIRVPVHVGAALFDPAVPPPGQFAVYNALAGPKDLLVLSAGHFTYPDQEREQRTLHRAQRAFLA
jgi:cephalosporin-C deacetylase